MDIETLWGILYKERNMASLQDLPASFCEDVREYIARLQAEKREADDRRCELVEDEIRNARTKVEDIVRRRIGKLVKLASSGTKTPPKGMLEEEELIFKGVKRHVDEGKERIFALMMDGQEGEREAGREENRSDQEESSWHILKSAEPTSAKERDEELHIVRILEDLPTFMGTDGKIYKVKKEDVIMLPKTNAEILCKRGVAERFEGKEVNKGGEYEIGK